MNIKGHFRTVEYGDKFFRCEKAVLPEATPQGRIFCQFLAPRRAEYHNPEIPDDLEKHFFARGSPVPGETDVILLIYARQFFVQIGIGGQRQEKGLAYAIGSVIPQASFRIGKVVIII
jgi:hypothetical protein